MTFPENQPAPWPKGRPGSHLWRLIEMGLGGLVVILLVALIAVTCVDVIGRYFLNTPLTGAFEMTEILLAALVFSALPMTTERRAHVEVDLLAGKFKGGFEKLMLWSSALFLAAVLLTFACGWRRIP